MQNKDQTFSGFCEFKALVEKESGKHVIFQNLQAVNWNINFFLMSSRR